MGLSPGEIHELYEENQLTAWRSLIGDPANPDRVDVNGEIDRVRRAALAQTKAQVRDGEAWRHYRNWATQLKAPKLVDGRKHRTSKHLADVYKRQVPGRATVVNPDPQ